jgi:hypothetical protein
MYVKRPITVGLWLIGGALIVSALWITASVMLLSAQSTQHDEYYMLPAPAVGIVVFGAGLLISLLFAKRLRLYGKGVVFVQRVHLVSTTVLVVTWSILQVLVGSVWQRDAQIPAMVLSATLVLMLVAHGIALAATGMFLSRGSAPTQER